MRIWPPTGSPHPAGSPRPNHCGDTHLRSAKLQRGFALSHRPGGGGGERLGAAIMTAAAKRRTGLLRIALHPDDLRSPGLRDVTLRAVESALRAGATATTYAGVVGR